MPDELFLRDIIRFGAQCNIQDVPRKNNPYYLFDVIKRAAWDLGWMNPTRWAPVSAYY